MHTSQMIRRIRRLPVLWWTGVAVLAVVVGSAVTTSVSRAEAASERFDGEVRVAVATRDLAPGSVVGSDDVRIEDRPRAFLAQSPVTAEPSGKVLTTAVLAGEVFVDAKLVPGGSSPIASLLRPGERAVSVPLHGSDLRLQVADTVDLIGSFTDAGGSEDTAVVLASGARVLDLGEDSVAVAVGRVDAGRVAIAASGGHVAVALTGIS